MSGIRYPHWTRRRDAPNDYFPRPGINVSEVMRDIQQEERLKRLSQLPHHPRPQPS